MIFIKNPYFRFLLQQAYIYILTFIYKCISGKVHTNVLFKIQKIDYNIHAQFNSTIIRFKISFACQIARPYKELKNSAWQNIIDKFIIIRIS